MSESFMFQAIIYLVAAVIMVPIAKRLGLGSVLGYLIAGTLIGPGVLGFIGTEGQDIMHFAEFGVVMMLFLIGLELEPELLWKMRRSIAGLGGLQVVLTTALVTIIAMVGFNMPWQQALAVAMAVAMSSTAIVLQTMQEKGLMKSAAGQSSFSVLLFQDIAVIPMLAILPLLSTLPKVVDTASHGSTNWVQGMPALQQMLIVLGSVVAIVLAGRYLIKPLLRIVARSKVRELFTASALLLVVSIAWLMQQVGLSPALGTFLAGVVLANSEFRHELESDIEPFKGLLLGLFFIAVGASIDIDIILQKPLLILGIVAGIMAVKALILLALGKLFKISFDQNAIFSVALSQVGEFAFVLLSFCLTEGILPKYTIDVMMSVVAISMALTPLLWLLHERLILPHLGVLEQENSNESDEAIEETHPVIIAGFGHFGNTVGRFLRANGVNATYLDIDSDRVALLRRMGFKVYYGDASRHDLLRAAGAAHAKLLVIAIDNVEKRLEMIETAKKHFPNLHLYVRSRNRFDAYELLNAGMLHVYRESLDTSLRMGVDVLKMLGHDAYHATRMSKMFLKYDEKNLKKLAAIEDREAYILEARTRMEELERLLQEDTNNRLMLQVDAAWDDASLIKEATQQATT